MTEPGVFETMRVRGGTVPLLAAHHGRLRAATRALELPFPNDVVERLEAFAASGELVVRLTVDSDGSRLETRDAPAARPFTLARAAVTHRPYPHKSTERAVFDDARAEAESAGADEALLLTAAGELAEGSITSVAFWRDGVLCFPSLDLGILPGVGRARLIGVARAAGVPVEEGRYVEGDWRRRPLLLVNAVRGVIEVASLDGVTLPLAARTAHLAPAFWP